jgi:hypothetical protein
MQNPPRKGLLDQVRDAISFAHKQCPDGPANDPVHVKHIQEEDEEDGQIDRNAHHTRTVGGLSWSCSIYLQTERSCCLTNTPGSRSHGALLFDCTYIL